MSDTLKSGYPKENLLRAIYKCIYAVTRVIHSDWILSKSKIYSFSFSKHEVTKSYIKLLATDRPQLFLPKDRLI
jgi:hypothetical protein